MRSNPFEEYQQTINVLKYYAEMLYFVAVHKTKNAALSIGYLTTDSSE